MTPYYAEPGFAPPPFLETLGDPLDDCWRCTLKPGDFPTGLCKECYEYLREEEP